MNTADGENGYFATWMGSNTNPSWGFTKFTVSAAEVSGQFVNALGSFTDSFTISSSVPLPAQQNSLFLPTDDAYTRLDYPNTNFGFGTSLVVDNSPVKNLLVKFNVTGIAFPNVTSVKLRLFQTDSSDRGGDFRRVSSNWSEKTITWNNAPPADPSIIASLGPVTSGKWYEIDLTSTLTSKGVFSLRVTSPSGDGAYYSSKEGANSPMLLIAMSTPPAPPPPRPLSAPPSWPTGSFLGMTRV